MMHMIPSFTINPRPEACSGSRCNPPHGATRSQPRPEASSGSRLTLPKDIMPAMYSTAQRSYVSTERGPAKLVQYAQLPCNMSLKEHPLQCIAPYPNTPA